MGGGSGGPLLSGWHWPDKRRAGLGGGKNTQCCVRVVPGLSPGAFSPRVPSNGLPYFHQRPQVRLLLLALLCVAVSVLWAVYRNEDQ